MIKVEVFAPKSLFKDKEFRSQVKHVLTGEAQYTLTRLFWRTTRRWKNRPKFNRKYRRTSLSMEMTVSTQDKIYNLVNSGASPHTITASKAPRLHFQIGYRAATSPRVIASTHFVRFGKFVHPYTVKHPGFVAREFTKAIAEEYGPKFKAKIDLIIEDAIARERNTK